MDSRLGENMISAPNTCQWFIDDIQLSEPLIEMSPHTVTTSTQVITLIHKAAKALFILCFLTRHLPLLKSTHNFICQ